MRKRTNKHMHLSKPSTTPEGGSQWCFWLEVFVATLSVPSTWQENQFKQWRISLQTHHTLGQEICKEKPRHVSAPALERARRMKCRQLELPDSLLRFPKPFWQALCKSLLKHEVQPGSRTRLGSRQRSRNESCLLVPWKKVWCPTLPR